VDYILADGHSILTTPIMSVLTLEIAVRCVVSGRAPVAPVFALISGSKFIYPLSFTRTDDRRMFAMAIKCVENKCDIKHDRLDKLLDYQVLTSGKSDILAIPDNMPPSVARNIQTNFFRGQPTTCADIS
jgi:hypothetical protein